MIRVQEVEDHRVEVRGLGVGSFNGFQVDHD